MNVELMEQAYLTQQLRLERDVKQAEDLLQNYCETAINKGLQVKFDCKMDGDPGHCICESAQNWGADLIVLGRRGRTGLAEAFLGSVSNCSSPCILLGFRNSGIEERTIIFFHRSGGYEC